MRLKSLLKRKAVYRRQPNSGTLKEIEGYAYAIEFERIIPSVVVE